MKSPSKVKEYQQATTGSYTVHSLNMKVDYANKLKPSKMYLVLLLHYQGHWHYGIAIPSYFAASAQNLCLFIQNIFVSTIFFGPQKCWSQKKFRTKKGLEAKIINLKQDPVVNHHHVYYSRKNINRNRKKK